MRKNRKGRYSETYLLTSACRGRGGGKKEPKSLSSDNLRGRWAAARSLKGEKKKEREGAPRTAGAALPKKGRKKKKGGRGTLFLLFQMLAHVGKGEKKEKGSSARLSSPSLMFLACERKGREEKKREWGGGRGCLSL